ncbi:hypothetical protein Cgig2_032194 [Carnegiea gigantea]|uniref:Uncharacterized protein n=1 Tax=Carnegiea gigantea TaxID=171969 RepID=A0A9Q1K412_9CARY|nr:hypothetical protein Cgig2_032194 [Carnegiea gigantea]
MVINNAAELRLLSRETIRSRMLNLHELRWDIVEAWLLSIEERLRDTQVPRLVETVYNPRPRPEVTSRLRDAPLPSSDEEYILVPSSNIACCTCIIVFSSCSPSGEVPEGLAGPPVEGLHPQLASLPAFIHGRAVTVVPRKNQCREPKKIPYAMPLFEPGTPSSSSCEYSSTPSILSLEVEVLYPWEITIADYMTDFKRTAVEKQYLLPAGYTFVIPEANVNVNAPPTKCIAVYHAALNYGLRFPLHPVVEDKLAPVQVVPTSWHNICSFITTCELHDLTCTARAFSLVHIVQRAPKETGDLGWYCFNNRPGFMKAIEKKSKVKY